MISQIFCNSGKPKPIHDDSTSMSKYLPPVIQSSLMSIRNEPTSQRSNPPFRKTPNTCGSAFELSVHPLHHIRGLCTIRVLFRKRGITHESREELLDGIGCFLIFPSV